MSSLILAVMAAHAAEPMTAKDVAARILEVDPDVAAAVAEQNRAQLAITGERHRYGLGATYSASASENANPSMFGTTAFVGESLLYSGSVGLEADTAFGGSAALTFDLGRSTSTNLLATSGEEFKNGPTSTATTRLTLRQDLGAGAGFATGRSGLRQAESSAVSAESTALDTASAAVRDGVLAYWEVVYATEALDIERRLTATARRNRDDTALRVESGSLAPVDLLPFESTLAAREEALVTAEATVESRVLALQRRLRLDAPPVLAIPPLADLPVPAVPDAGVQARALERSTAVRSARAAVTLAELQAATAGNDLLPALGVEAWVQAETLADSSGARVGPTEAISAWVGVSGALDFDRTRYRVERSRADLAVSASRDRLAAVELDALASVRDVLTDDAAARRKIALAERTLDVATRQLAATLAREESGSALPIEVRQAYDDARDAEVRLLRARIDAIAATVSLAHLTGDLVDGAVSRAGD